MPRSTPSNDLDTFAYAVSFLEAAKLVGAEGKWEDNAPMVVPFYMLIGFGLENALKSFLERCEGRQRRSWSHSHSLSDLRSRAEEHGLTFYENAAAFIDGLSKPHLEHQFRYPQKAERAALHQPSFALSMTEGIYRLVFEAIDGPSRRSEI